MPSKENYKLVGITVTVTDSGQQLMKEFWRLYCITCEKESKHYSVIPQAASGRSWFKCKSK